MTFISKSALYFLVMLFYIMVLTCYISNCIFSLENPAILFGLLFNCIVGYITHPQSIVGNWSHGPFVNGNGQGFLVLGSMATLPRKQKREFKSLNQLRPQGMKTSLSPFALKYSITVRFICSWNVFLLEPPAISLLTLFFSLFNNDYRSKEIIAPFVVRLNYSEISFSIAFGVCESISASASEHLSDVELQIQIHCDLFNSS